MNAQGYDYDVVLLSDLRYPGGNSASLVEEIKAQARAGWSTGLMHLPAPHMARRRAFNRQITHCLAAGLAELVPPERSVRTRALVIRQPRLFTEDPAVPLSIRADSAVLAVNHPPADGFRDGQDPYYDIAAVRDRVNSLFGEVRWAPIGPAVRCLLVDSGVPLELYERDWVNVLDVGEWRVPRDDFRAERPVIGRHSRDHRTKWPAERGQILAVYPAREDVAVKVLGGADTAIRMLGHQPRNWTVYPFGAMPPPRFLEEVDFFVYYHHPEWVESFGRNIIEGMASGCPAILPPHFERLFGDHCLYAAPDGVRELVDGLYRNPGDYRARSARGVEYVEAEFGAGTHVRRVQELIGDRVSPAARRPASGPRARRVLLVSGRRRGIGSMVRLLRVATRLPDDLSPVLLGPWPATRLGREAGVLTELIPDDELAEGAVAHLAERVQAIAELHGVSAALVDAPRLGSDALEVPSVRIAATDLGDVSRDAAGGEVAVLSPGFERLPRAEARAQLRADPGERLALLCVGSDERDILIPRVWLAAEALLERGWSVVFADPLVGGAEVRLPEPVARRPLLPIARYLDAFDAAVAVPGHTLSHELVAAGCPALLVPFGHDADDSARAAGMRERGLALAVDEFSEEDLGARLEELGDERVRSELAATGGAVRLADAAPPIVERVLEAVRRT